MADDNNPVLTTEFKIDEQSVNKEFDALEGKAEKAGKKVNDSFSGAFSGTGIEKLSVGLIGINQGLELAEKAIHAVEAAFSKFSDQFILAEQVKATEIQFDILSQKAGVSGEALREGLEAAGKGTLSTNEILKTANESLVLLGNNAKNLPELFSLARKSSIIFGKSALEVLNDLNLAISTGFARAVKREGFNFDPQKVFKDFAKSVGLTVDQLSQAGRQQAILNAVLESGRKNLGDVDASVKKVTISFAQMKAAEEEAAEAGALTISKVFGPLAQAVSETLTAKLRSFSAVLIDTFNVGNAADQAAAKIQLLKDKISALQSERGRALFEDDDARAEVLSARIKEVTQDLEILRKAKVKDIEASEHAAELAKDATPFVGDRDKIAKNLNEVNKEIAAGAQANLQLQIQSAQQIEDVHAREAELRKLSLGAAEIEEQQHLQRLEALRIKFAIDGALTSKQYNELVNQENIRSNLEQEKIEEEAGKIKKQRLMQEAAQFKSIIVSGISSTIQQIGFNLQQGQSLFDSFGQGVVGIIGDMAIKLGEGLVAQGLALEAFVDALNTLLPGSGFAAAAAGVGLILFGSALKASVGLGGGGGSNTGGGGIATTPSTTTSITQAGEFKPEAPGTTVNVNIAGNILDRRQTGLELTEVIREAFEQQGTVTVTSNT